MLGGGEDTRICTACIKVMYPNTLKTDAPGRQGRMRVRMRTRAGWGGGGWGGGYENMHSHVAKSFIQYTKDRRARKTPRVTCLIQTCVLTYLSRIIKKIKTQER